MTTSYHEYFRGKCITLMGLGLLGRGVGDARFLAECGAELIVTDKKSAEELATSVAELSDLPNITFRLGEHNLEDFRDRDLIIKAAGVPQDSPFIAEARAAGIPIAMTTALFSQFAKEAGATIVGVTGTRGKSTTTAMIAEILEQAGKSVLVGGNVRGVSTLALLPEVTAETHAVLELDSWQLQGFGEAKLGPDVGVFTTLYPDHLNYYKNDTAAYLADKANIFLYQDEADTIVVGEQAADTVLARYGDAMPARRVIARATDVPQDWVLGVLGEHNRANAACALAAARALGVDDGITRAALQSFRGVPGRLENLGVFAGVRVYNDNNATTPDATLAAIRALTEVGVKNVILIMGGDDKGLDMSALVAELPRCKAVVLFKERGTDRIREQVFALEHEGLQVFQEEGLAACVEQAFHVAAAGDIILYSPAFSSFGRFFKNEYDRNDQFVALIQSHNQS